MRHTAVLALSIAILACHPAQAPARPLDPRAARLCGTWRAVQPGNGTFEEHWRPSADGLIGEGVASDPQGAVLGRERLAIILAPETSTYRAHPVGAQAPTDFAEVERGDPAASNWVWAWANPAHDFPQSIRYEFRGTELQATVSGPEGAGPTLVFEFERVGPCVGTSTASG